MGAVWEVGWTSWGPSGARLRLVFLLKRRDTDLGSDVASFWSFDYFVKRRDKDLGFDVISFRSLVSLFKQRDKDLVSAAWLSLQRLKTSFQSAKIGFQSAKACFQNAKIGFWNSAAATRGLDSSFDTRHGILLNSATVGNKHKCEGCGAPTDPERFFALSFRA